MKVEIGPVVFDIEQVNGLLSKDGTEKLNGHILYGETKILVEKGMSEEMIRLTLIHEITHGIATYAGIEMPEKDVEAFANVLTAFLKHNLEFVTDLFRSEP